MSLSLLLFCLVPLAACGSGDGDKGEAEAAEPAETGEPAASQAPSLMASAGTVLRIAETVFTGADFERYILDTTGSAPAKFDVRTLSRLFDRFVEERLLVRAAADEGVSLSPDEQKAALARPLADRGAAPGRPEAAGGAGSGQAFLDRALIEKYSALIMRDVQVNDEDVAAYYEAHKKGFLEQARVKVSQILLPSEERAVAVLNRVKSATEDEFRTAARQESVGLEAPKGGAMGIFKPGELPYEMEKVVFALAEGEVSRVVESSYGFHIFRLDRRFEPELLSVESATPAIRARILTERGREALAERLETLRGRLEWQVFPENLSFPYQRNNQ